MKYIIGNPSGLTIDQVIDLGNNEHFSKLTCSIIPTIDYWKDLNNKILKGIIVEDYDICFEYPVKSISKAKSSYTDIMLISDQTNIAVESKWNEKVGYYCKDHKSKRKVEVQLHWLSIISQFINKELSIEQFSEIEYQLLHRVASACSLKKNNCIIIYQIFYKDSFSNSFVNEIIKLMTILGDSKIKFYINSVQIKFTDNYLQLQKEIIELSKDEKIDKIKESLKRNTFFEFYNESLYLLKI